MLDAPQHFAVERGQPAARRVVVVRARVGHAAGLVHVRQMRVVAAPVEAELDHMHPGQLEATPQRLNVGRDDPKILGDERQCVADVPLQRVEQLDATRGQPLTFARRRGAGRHGPVRGEAAEVIESQQIVPRELTADAATPV
jgi:hypothetical protein